MGCGTSSQVDPQDPSIGDKQVNESHNSTVSKQVKQQNKAVSSKQPKVPSVQQDTTANVPKSVAFEIEFESNKTSAGLARNPPKKFQKLEPLENAPRLTAEQLEEKIRIAEDKRQLELEKKKRSSLKSSRVRQQILQAREVDKEIDQMKEIEDKIKAAEKAKEIKLKAVQDKQKMKQERAKRARAKARRLKEGEDEGYDMELEKDDAFNNNDTDSWLGETSDYHTDPGERYTSGESYGKGGKISKDIKDTRLTASPYNEKHDDFFD